MQNTNREFKKLKYFKCMAICHGKSEYVILENAKFGLRLYNMFEVHADSNGKSSIQIKGLLKYLNKKPFISEDKFISFYKDKLKNKRLDDDFKIFIIMDTDDIELTSQDIERYKNREMFKGHWAYKYIVPIYNTKNIEDILLKIGVINRDTKKTDYGKIFPINKKSKEADIKQVKEVIEKLSVMNNTNMDEMFAHLVMIAESYSI